jgi:hypothetical protein
MRRSHFDETLSVCFPKQLTKLLTATATRHASTPSDIVRRGVVRELAAMGVAYVPSNDNGDAPRAA